MDRRISRRIAAFLIATSFITASLTGCGDSALNDPGFAKGDPWIDSDILGSITESDEIRPQDDFAAAANKDWILTEGVTIKERSIDHIADVVSDNMIELLKDGDLPGKEGQELKKFADLGMDWNYRNNMGVEPLRPYIESIDAISTVDEYYDFITDNKKNPLGLGLVKIDSNMSRFKAFPDEVTVVYEPADLSLGYPKAYYNAIGAVLETKEVNEEKLTYTLSRLGYTDDDIKKLFKDMYAVEKKIASITPQEIPDDDGDLEIKRTDEYKDLTDAAGAYPLDKYMKSHGYENIKHMMGDRIYLEKISRICTESNLPGLKAMLKFGYVTKTGTFLDKNTYDTFTELSKSRTEKEPPDYSTDKEKERDLLCTQIKMSGVSAAMDKLYLDKYISPESAEELTNLTKDIIDIYRTKIFPNESWMSEEGKKLCLEKLDAITLNVIYPDMSSIDYSDLNIVSKEDGGSYLEAYFDSIRYLNAMIGKNAGMKYERTRWYPYYSNLSTTATNSSYVPEANSINIYAGILEDPAYHPGMSKEELYSGIGAIIGHEITHGFDINGVRYNKEGVRESWLSDQDAQAFSDKAGKVSTYYTILKPYKGSGFYDGSRVTAEVVADMGGLKAMLTLAEKEADFDYDKFFRHYAKLWAAQVSPEKEQYYFKNDVHPLNVLRVNVNVQQYDKFYETYNVQPDDKMYKAEDDRIAVW